jgi:hypothetical protein
MNKTQKKITILIITAVIVISVLFLLTATGNTAWSEATA